MSNELSRPGAAVPTPLALAVGLALAHSSAAAQASAVELDRMVVTASGHEQAMTDAPASISIITRQELEEKRAGSVAEALEGVEGVDVGAPVGKTGGMDISIRGMPSEYTLILIDGRRQNVAGDVTPNGFGSTQTSFMPPVSAIERIEVIRGPMSTLYGSDAMGGVVNIITRPVAQQWAGELGLESTFHPDSDFGDSRAVSLYGSGPLVRDRLGLQLRGRLFERDAADLLFTDDAGNPIEVSKRGPSPVEGDVYSVGGRLSFAAAEDHELWLDAERSRQWYNNDEGQLGTLDDPPDGQIAGYSDALRFNRDQVALGHTGELAVGTLESSVMHNTTETLGRTIPGDPTGGDLGQPYPGFPELVVGAPRELETRNLVVDTKLTAPVGTHVLTLGGQWWDAELTDGLATKAFSQTTWALFGEDEWMLSDELTLTFGARHDQHDAFGSELSPRAYLVWSATDRWTLKGGVSKGYRAPELNDLHEGINGVTGQGTVLTIGNPDLQPETSVSGEIGMHYEHPRGYGFGATVFHSTFDDKIADGPDRAVIGHPTIPDGTYGQLVNVDEAVTRGVELNGRLPLAPRWMLSANYTYTDSEQKSGAEAGEPLTDTPEHLANATLRWQASERWNAWLRGEYASERHRPRAQVRGAASRADLGNYKAYALFHAGGSYQATETLTFDAAVYNLLDQDFIDYGAYTLESGPSAGELRYGNRYANIEPGRRLWLSMRLAF